MNLTMNGIFDELRPHIPNSLVSPEVIAGIRELNGKLPAALTTTGGFECHLGTREGAADWQLCIFRSSAGREIAAGTLPQTDIDASLFADPLWQQVRRFSGTWADPFSILHEKIEKMWLEFDRDTMKKTIPVPGICFSTQEASDGSVITTGNSARYAWVIDALELLQGKPLRKEIARKLRMCFDALPAGAQMNFAAMMLSRNRDAARILLRLDQVDLPDYLARIEYPGSIQAVMNVTAAMAPVAGLRYLIDVSDTVLPDIGVECFFDTSHNNCGILWGRFLDHLVARGLCVPEKRDAFLSWPGHSCATLPNELFPCYIFRDISHIKIICRGSGSLEAKGYLIFSRRFTADIISELQLIRAAD
jgi:hypothetical protein